MSLAEKLAALTNPEPVFADPEVELDITAAKVVEREVDDDADYLAVGTSSLRIKNAEPAAGGRYSGKKVSRAAMAKARGQEEGEDFKEHSAADLGHMFQFDDDAGDSEDDDDDNGADNDDDDDDDENESNEGSDDEDDLEVEEEEEAEGVMNEKETSKNKEDEFVFDKNDSDFGQFGGMDDDDDNDDDDDDSEEDDDDEEASGGDTVSGDEEATAVDPLVGGSVEEEVEKGRAVREQLQVWDKLLESRIQQQKLLSRVNRLPVAEYWNMLNTSGDQDFQEQIKQSQKALKLLLNDLITLESVLVNNADDTEEPEAKRRKLDEFSSCLATSHQTFQPDRNSIIQKWNDKTKISAGKNSFSSMETSTVTQIEQILSNKGRLVERTRMKRSTYQTIGRDGVVAADDQIIETDVDVFDDDDFYHQLLRDLIDRKTNSSADQSQLTRQWLEVQKLRTKLKKKVDTKASKGRKVRYDIHAKLVNFMAPVYDRSAREETNNELFSSLFGTRR